ncbi:MAG TPA: TIGR03435 family protein [Candidatus Solibacter sp.]|nr:TIGR03435 family protein [Candidatus Solibacter sp.]
MRAWLTALALLAALPAFPQDVDTRPNFTVAAIRQCNGTEPRGAVLNGSPGRLSLPCWGLSRLIQEAYQTFADATPNFMYQPAAATPIEGFPKPMSSDSYAIEAKAQSAQSMAMMRGPMMQRLLEERFHMRVHRETREVPVYIMTIAKDGSKLRAATEDSCNQTPATEFIQPLKAPPGGKPWCGVLTPPVRNGTHFVMDQHGIRVEAFAKLFQIGGLPVVDRTGLTGTFDIHLEWEFDTVSRDDGAASEPPDPSIISSMRKQLGLQLTPGKGPREFIVIEHLERPSEN